MYIQRRNETCFSNSDLLETETSLPKRESLLANISSLIKGGDNVTFLAGVERRHTGINKPRNSVPLNELPP